MAMANRKFILSIRHWIDLSAKVVLLQDELNELAVLFRDEVHSHYLPSDV
jgi:hypothetical protein